MTYSAVVIGAGNIAGGYDSPGSPQILTHLHALRSDPRFVCEALYDLDTDRARQMGSLWGVPVAETLEEVLQRPFDVAVIAVPDPHHATYLEQLAGHDVGLVLCEKPLTQDIDQAREIAARYKAAGRTLMVNYQRRFEQSVRRLRTDIDAGALGQPLSGAVWYSKGIRHNGSHAIDLLRFLFGEVQATIGRRKTFDFTEVDPSVSGTVRFSNVDIELLTGDERLFSIFEIDLLFEKGRYRYSQSGMQLERFEVRPDPVFPGYFEQLPVGSGPTALSTALGDVYAAIGDFLDTGAPLPATIDDAVATQAICESLASQELDNWVRSI
ncbi:Gfo/Idh/MocA family oxidoreductase [Hoeflea sp. AS16]|uniref:Gfo/Idh/MocA family protein n=1 Tax=Hoeflea sp. AS16 TaxID=3135779 RepID=UPI0031799876